jgi:2-polyprenyl-3-methyl-5-hydroxy-6-metoxy-1,4-benzoquinol methylase
LSYFLPEGYKERLGAVQQVDVLEDQWQKEVYEAAKDVWRRNGLDRVVDVGTGSAFKLLKYFGGDPLAVTGLDLQSAVDVLRKKYPGNSWSTLERYFKSGVWSVCQIDLLICADMIEHVDDPDAILGIFAQMKPRWLVISTPDRELLPTPLGPPANPQHVREWAFHEFHQYISQWFSIVRHWHSNRAQATQCIICDTGAATKKSCSRSSRSAATSS